MSSPQQESFQSMATVFILQDKTWIERGSGLVRFVFDLRTFALRLVIRPGTPDEFECKLRPRIRSKGPRAYVVRAQAENGTDEHILAVRFEREEDSRSFRRFVEKRDVDHNQKNNSNANAQNPSSYPSAHLRNQTDYTNNSAVQQQYGSSRHNNRGSSNIAQNGYNQYQSHAMRAVQAQQVNGTNNAYNNTMYGSPNNNNNNNINNNNNNNNIQSPSSGNNNKHGSGVQANYFWTCSRCLQMVDPSLTSCHVCGTLRQENQNQNNTNYHHQSGNPNGIQQQINGPNNNGNPNVLQQINGPNNNYSSHGHHGNNNNNNNNNNNHSNIHNSNIHGSNTHSNHPSNLASYGSNVHHQIRNPSTLHNSSHHPSYPSHHPSGSGGSHPSSQHHPNVIQQPNVHILKLTTVNLEKHNKLFPPKRRNVKEIIQTQLEWLRTHQ